MDKRAIKELMYGGLKELTTNSSLYYGSSNDRRFNHFTKAGELALFEFCNEMAKFIAEAEDKELDQRAKDMVLKELKS